jgi:ComF family protein
MFGDIAEPGCIACRISPPPYERCIAPLRYATPVAEMIRRVKFANGLSEARVLGSILGEQVVQMHAAAEVDVIVPVPLGRARLLRRGHNQAALLAHWVGRAGGLPVDYRLCRRTRATRAQSGLSRRARRVNLRGAFAVDARLDDTRIAIVDDVVTTGATVAALGRTLLRAGAATVQVWAVARTLEREPRSNPGF